jgi:ferric-dicitrate binding protein FerR (iron transport regulator)
MERPIDRTQILGNVLMTEKQRIKKVIKEYLSGKESEEGKALFEKWYASFNDTDLLKGSFSGEEKEKIEGELLSNIKRRLQTVERAQEEKQVIALDSSSLGETTTIHYKKLLRFAAVFACIFLFSGLIYSLYYADHLQSYSTEFGEIESVTLPDQSVVVLNGNSTLKYNPNWDTNDDREVWLEGEGFFSVVHTRNHSKFVVHTSEDFNVQVLGTEFNVYNRKRGTKVVLNSGKVRLNIRDHDNINLQPGQLAEFKDNPEKYTIKEVDPHLYSSWKNKKFTFKNTDLREVIIILEEVYGLSVMVQDKKILDQKISGSVPGDDLDNLLFGLSETIDLKIKRDGNNLVFQENPGN